VRTARRKRRKPRRYALEVWRCVFDVGAVSLSKIMVNVVGVPEEEDPDFNLTWSRLLRGLNRWIRYIPIGSTLSGNPHYKLVKRTLKIVNPKGERARWILTLWYVGMDPEYWEKREEVRLFIREVLGWDPDAPRKGVCDFCPHRHICGGISIFA